MRRSASPCVRRPRRWRTVWRSIAVVPSLVSFAIRRAILGTDRALEGSTQMLVARAGTGRRLPAARVPGPDARALRPIRDHPVRDDLQPGRRPARRERLRRTALPSRPGPPRARRPARRRRARPERRRHARHRRSRSADSRAARSPRRSSASAKAPGSAAPPSCSPTSAGTASSAPAPSSPTPIPDYAVAAGVPARVIRSRQPVTAGA